MYYCTGSSKTKLRTDLNIKDVAFWYDSAFFLYLVYQLGKLAQKVGETWHTMVALAKVFVSIEFTKNWIQQNSDRDVSRDVRREYSRQDYSQ